MVKYVMFSIITLLDYHLSTPINQQLAEKILLSFLFQRGVCVSIYTYIQVFVRMRCVYTSTHIPKRFKTILWKMVVAA